MTPTLKNVAIPIYPDTTVEGPEDFGVNLYDVSLNATIVSRTGTVDILDDDPVSGGVTVSVGDVTVVEGAHAGMRKPSLFVTLGPAERSRSRRLRDRGCDGQLCQGLRDHTPARRRLPQLQW